MFRHQKFNAILLGFAVLSGLQAAHACSCGPCDQKTSFLDSEAYSFIGSARVESVEAPTGPFDKIITLVPVKVLRGDATDRIQIKTSSSGASCGVGYSVGAMVRIAATQSGGYLHTNLCTQMCWTSAANSALLPGEFGGPLPIVIDASPVKPPLDFLQTGSGPVQSADEKD
ncbi:MAG: hypothetical protein AAGJ84_14300 [Pseudomonadota bacterium]